MVVKTVRLNVTLTIEESEILKQYSAQKHRSQSDVIREFIRGLEKISNN